MFLLIYINPFLIAYTNTTGITHIRIAVKLNSVVLWSRPRRRWVDNIRMDLQEVGCGHVDWIGLAKDRDGWRKLVNAVMNLRVP